MIVDYFIDHSKIKMLIILLNIIIGNLQTKVGLTLTHLTPFS